jgi:hypothetical protein
LFTSKGFEDFASSIGFKLINSSPYYAQANGQAEASNQILINIIKKRSNIILGSSIQYLLKLFGLTGWLVMDQLNVHLMNWFMGMKVFCHGRLVWDFEGYHSKIN